MLESSFSRAEPAPTGVEPGAVIVGAGSAREGRNAVYLSRNASVRAFSTGLSR